MSMQSLLRWLGWLPEISRDDIIDASIENKLFDFERAADAVKTVTDNSRKAVTALRATVIDARERHAATLARMGVTDNKRNGDTNNVL